MAKIRPSVRTKPESQVTREVIQALAAFRYAVDLGRQNTGGFYNPRGQYVAFSSPGNSDWSGMFTAGAWRGCKLDLEIKREGFDPRRARGKERTRFLSQLDRLKRTNEQGGVGFWVSDGEQILSALPKILAGARVVFCQDGFPYLEVD